MPRRIFISHSNSDPDSSAYIDAIEAALRPAGFEILVDRGRLVPGALWRDEIYTWMGMCHAAVILVSDAAIRPESIWVPRETSILLWRRTLDPKFTVIPACLGAVVPDDLRGGVFSDLQLGEVQTAPATTPTELAAALLARLTPLALPKTPLETLASRLAELLSSASDRVIEDAIEPLPGEPDARSWADDRRYALALALLQAPMRESVPALEVLADFLQGSRMDQIICMIAPSWVDLCAARWLADCGSRSEGKPAAILNAQTWFSARMYVDRASCRPPKTRWPVINSTGIYGERAAQEIAAEIEQNLIQEFRLADDPQVDPAARLGALLRARQADGRPVFAALPYSPGIAKALPELQRLLPNVTLIVLSGSEFPDPGQIAGRLVRLIEPRLAEGVEERARLDFDVVRSIIPSEEARN